MNNQPPICIYFAGADGTGKTTLCLYVAKTYGLPMINEVARSVLADSRKTFAEIRTTGAASSEFQAEVFRRQFEAEAQLEPPYVSDRTVDNLAYAEEHARNFGKLFHAVKAEYLASLRQSIVFLVRPQRALRPQASTDPFRLLSEWEGQVRIDAVVETLFQIWSIPYIPIVEVDSSRRERLVDWCLQAHGFRPASGAKP